jgi:purine-cytosine permease-like protein
VILLAVLAITGWFIVGTVAVVRFVKDLKVAESPVSARSVEAREGAVTFSAPHGTDGTQHLIVRACELRVGDVLSTGAIVIGAPIEWGPYVEVRVALRSGHHRTVHLNAEPRFPTVHIERPVTV